MIIVALSRLKKHVAPLELTVDTRYIFSTNIAPLTGRAQPIDNGP